jgi:hypothetical protein
VAVPRQQGRPAGQGRALRAQVSTPLAASCRWAGPPTPAATPGRRQLPRGRAAHARSRPLPPALHPPSRPSTHLQVRLRPGLRRRRHQRQHLPCHRPLGRHPGAHRRQRHSLCLRWAGDSGRWCTGSGPGEARDAAAWPPPMRQRQSPQ